MSQIITSKQIRLRTTLGGRRRRRSKETVPEIHSRIAPLGMTNVSDTFSQTMLCETSIKIGD